MWRLALWLRRFGGQRGRGADGGTGGGRGALGVRAQARRLAAGREVRGRGRHAGLGVEVLGSRGATRL